VQSGRGALRIELSNRNEKATRLHYGEGTFGAEPLAQALTRFTRPATPIAESADEVSNQAVRAILQPARAPA
jgi:hypothetical protein